MAILGRSYFTLGVTIPSPLTPCRFGMSLSPTLLAVALLAMVLPAIAGDVEDGLAFYRVGEYDKALHLFRKAASQDDPNGQYNLAVMISRGHGAPKNDEQAVSLFRKSAEAGNALAQYNLAYAYADGKGVKQDHELSRQWYWKSAEQGYARAQHNLGDIYAKGVGVPQNLTEAARWFEMAARNGSPRSQFNIGIMYATGQGLPRSFSEAVFWLRIAEASGHEKALRNRQAAESQLSPSDRERALARAESYLRKNPPVARDPEVAW